MLRIIVRRCSQFASKAEWKMSWNRDNKQLFGAVAKVKKAKKIKKSVDQEPYIPPAEATKPTEPILSSEMHWMLSSGYTRRRMLAKPYDNTERIALKVSDPVENAKEERSKSYFDAILKVPMITRQDSRALEIPELEFNEVPSVGKILQATMSDGARNALTQWKLAKVEELGVPGFERLQRENLDRGLRFHNMLQEYFTKESAEKLITEEDPNYPVWKSVQSVLPEIDKQALFVEKRVRHPVLHYKGVVDCVSSIGNNIYCIEWKNSEKTKSTIAATFDAPLQLCAYLGALNASPEHNVEISSGMVVVAYQSGRPADYYKLNEVQLNKYWYAWLLRVQEYWIRHRDGTLPEPIF